MTAERMGAWVGLRNPSMDCLPDRSDDRRILIGACHELVSREVVEVVEMVHR